MMQNNAAVDPIELISQRNRLKKLADKQQKANNAREFLKTMSSVRYMSTLERTRQKAEEAQAARLEKERQSRINELLSMIASLRQKLANSGYDKKIASQLSLLQGELFWLMLAI